MKTHKVTDERLILQKQKINSDTLLIAYGGLGLSVLIQTLFLNSPPSHYLPEGILFLILSLYLLIRHILTGNRLFPQAKSNALLLFVGSSSVAIGATLAMLLGYLRRANLQDSPVSPFAVACVLFLINLTIALAIAFLIDRFSKRKQKQLDEKIKEEL